MELLGIHFDPVRRLGRKGVGRASGGQTPKQQVVAAQPQVSSRCALLLASGLWPRGRQPIVEVVSYPFRVEHILDFESDAVRELPDPGPQLVHLGLTFRDAVVRGGTAEEGSAAFVERFALGPDANRLVDDATAANRVPVALCRRGCWVSLASALTKQREPLVPFPSVSNRRRSYDMHRVPAFQSDRRDSQTKDARAATGRVADRAATTRLALPWIPVTGWVSRL